MQDIAFMLLNAGAYTNLQDRYGDTNLIYACKFFDHTTGGVETIKDFKNRMRFYTYVVVF